VSQDSNDQMQCFVHGEYRKFVSKWLK